tara:strand:- start:99 stop:479 length:381 start_codon:yes stop_codon:yes gene_type:complete
MNQDETKAQLLQHCRNIRDELSAVINLLEREMTQEDFPQTPSQVIHTPLTERHYWILDQLREGDKLTRSAVEKKFNLCSKQAKRILNPLVKQNLIRFARSPKPGHYELILKLPHYNSIQNNALTPS